MTADRMERVKQKARENWADSMRPLTQYPLTAYLMGAEFGIESYRTLSEAEWAEMRETVARALYPSLWEDGAYAGVHFGESPKDALNRERSYWLTKAEAAMRAVFRKEGE